MDPGFEMPGQSMDDDASSSMGHGFRPIAAVAMLGGDQMAQPGVESGPLAN
jgi:hypothetical protein